MTFARGEMVRVTYLGRTVEAEIILASSNGRSLMLQFDAILGNYVGMMPVLEVDGLYHDLLTSNEVSIEKLPDEATT